MEQLLHSSHTEKLPLMLPTSAGKATNSTASTLCTQLESPARGQQSQRSNAPIDQDSDVGIHYEPGIYNSVLVAAFGGIKMQLEGGVKAKMHPLFLFVLCIPLFITQVSAILALRVDMDIDREFLQWEDAHDRLLIGLKILMIMILQIINFKYLMGTIRKLVFVMNPITWVETRSPTMDEWLISPDLHSWRKYLFHPVILAPWPFLSLLMRLFVGYLVCVDSVSIILVSARVQDAIFNSLAITFLADLTGFYWELCASIFHLTPMDETHFKFELQPDIWALGDGPNMIADEKKTLLGCPNIAECIAKWAPWLRRGWGARKLEMLITFKCLLLIYTQQLFVILYAFKTNVIPVARDVCTTWRWHNGEAEFFRRTGSVESWLENHWLFANIYKAVDSAAETKLHGQCMPGQKYYRMLTSTKISMLMEHPCLICGIVLIIGSLLLLPQIARVIYFFSAGTGRLHLSKEVPTTSSQLRLLEHEHRKFRDLSRKQATEIEILQEELNNLRREFHTLASRYSNIGDTAKNEGAQEA